MSSETRLREDICLLARSMFERGLTHGSTGNISARLPDGGLLVTPTGSSFGRLDPALLARFDSAGRFIDGEAPTKEMPLHSAFYETSQSGAVVHLHSTHSIALSILPGIDPDDVLPPLTAYSVMKLGKVKLLPFFVPGDPRMGDAIRELAGRHPALILAHHGPVVAAADLHSAVDAVEELEATARLALLTHGLDPHRLSVEQIEVIRCRM
jgi:ribulose-5-phosphate 4-epimerase/fuculose-1-phosphate aldolase